MPEISLDLLTFYETTKALKSMEGKTALERAEAESRATAFTLAELIWVHHLLRDIGIPLPE